MSEPDHVRHDHNHDHDGRPVVGYWGDDPLLEALWREHPEYAPVNVLKPEQTRSVRREILNSVYFD